MLNIKTILLVIIGVVAISCNTKVKDDTSNPKLKTSLPEQCLIIRGQLLQPIPESYIVPQ